MINMYHGDLICDSKFKSLVYSDTLYMQFAFVWKDQRIEQYPKVSGESYRTAANWHNHIKEIPFFNMKNVRNYFVEYIKELWIDEV